MENIFDIKLCLLSKEHIEGLCHLYQIVFRKKVKPKYFELKYGLFKKDKQQFSTVALLENKVIGFMGAIEQRFRGNHHEIMLIQGCDYILLDEYRGKGYFNRIYNHTMQKAKRRNAMGLYAFQSEQTHKVTKKLGWKSEIGFNRFHIKAYPFSTSGLLRKLNLNDWRNSRLDSGLNPYLTNYNFNKHRLGEFYTQIYDTQFFREKSFASRYLINISSCILWLKYDFVLTVGFCYFERQADVKQMIKTLKRIALLAGIHEVVFQIQAKSEESKILEKYLQPQPSFKIDSLLFTEDFNFDLIKLNFMDMDIF